MNAKLYAFIHLRTSANQTIAQNYLTLDDPNEIGYPQTFQLKKSKSSI